MKKEIIESFGAIRKGYLFTVKNSRRLFAQMLGVSIVAISISLLVLASGGLFIDILEHMEETREYRITSGLVLLGILVMLMICVLEIVRSTAYNIMDRWGKKTGIWENAKRNAVPVFFYVLFMLLVAVVLIVMPDILMEFRIYEKLMEAGQHDAEGLHGVLPHGFSIVSILMVTPYTIAVAVSILFIIQFAILEIVIKRKGIFESIMNSVLIIKGSPIQVAFFYIVEIVLDAVIIVGITVAYLGIVTEGWSLLVSAYSVLAQEDALRAAEIVGGMLAVIFGIVLNTVLLSVIIPMKYYHWKEVRKKIQ